jgi:PAS domain S-box-containing protein
MIPLLKHLSPRARIAMGQIALLVSVLLLAVALGMMPSPNDATVDGRAQLCESNAINCSVIATRGDIDGLNAALHAIASRDRDILSIGVRGEDDNLIATEGDHELGWAKRKESAQGTCIEVPIFSNEKPWGTVEVIFRPLDRGGFVGLMTRPTAKMIYFVTFASWVLFYFYLKKTLQHLDPSKVVPGRVRSALDTLAEGLLVLDNEERIMLANHAFAAIAGQNPDEMIGKRVANLSWVTGTGEVPTFPWTRSIAENIPQQNVMLQLRDSEGKVRSFVVNCSPVMGHDGKHRGVLASFEDVTQLEAQKIELNKSKEAAEAANKAKSEFLARMSHEIRTPMNAILGFADVLRRGYEESAAERQEYLNTIHSSGQHLLELINDILDLSKIESGRLQIESTRCSPHQILAEVATVLRVKAKQKNIALDYRWDGAIPGTITTDPTRLRQVITNLVGNAVKFTEKGGVTIVARMAQKNTLAVDVIDTGIGIQRESLDRMFQPFMQADTSITRRFGGTGLGLNISKQLVEAMGGTLTVESEHGKGSTFTLTIDTGPLENVPMLASMPQQLALRGDEATPRAVMLPGIRVLSCEDGASNQKLITLVLKRAGVAVIDTAGNGQQGVEMASRGKYDVILMDMQMPIMDGYTAASTLRSHGCTTPIIAMTAHAMKGEEEKCREAGCTGYVPKPIEVDRLLRTIAELAGVRTTGASASATPQAAPAGAVATDGLKSALPMDDPDFKEVVIEFVDRLGDRLNEVQRAWEQRELAEVASIAHWLKGSGGTAGFDAFTGPAKRLEQVAKNQDLDQIQSAIEDLKTIASRIQVPAPPASPPASAPAESAPTESMERAGSIFARSNGGKQS